MSSESGSKQRAVVIIGASSGIGAAMAREYSRNGWTVGLVARRVELLEALKKELPGEAVVKRMDVSRPDEAASALKQLFAELGSVQLVVINSGVGGGGKELEWEHEQRIVSVNVAGFTLMAICAWNHFLKQGSGHIAGISSVAAVRGLAYAPAYSASKAYVGCYLEGLRHRAGKLGVDISITEIRPGFVDTPMTEGQKGMFWVASAQTVATQIYAAISLRKKLAYVTRRWGLAAGVMRVLPDWLYKKI